MSDAGLTFYSVTQGLLTGGTTTVSKRRTRVRIRWISRVEQAIRSILRPLNGFTRRGRGLADEGLGSNSWQGDDISFHRITTAQDDRRDT